MGYLAPQLLWLIWLGIAFIFLEGFLASFFVNIVLFGNDVISYRLMNPDAERFSFQICFTCISKNH
ncbi:hypothetical protein GV64_07860 [Endozoicomonas elysicola]|uniref:Uncharacterized protein n=1 Tax=Endozoicomonas elysicola TaxID=305900 RepID=A0A081K940_9GAMM|nr:hypothetical protein GV64_07860 [Endozoicomonas elysicola]